MKAIWNGSTLAESDDTIVVEGNHYFPPGSVNSDLLTKQIIIPSARGREPHTIIRLKLKESAIKMPHGFIPNPRKPRKKSPTTWLSGME